MSEAQLTVAADPGVIVTVLDGDLRRVAEAPGGVEVTLPSGLYQVRWLAGRALTEQVVQLSPAGLSVPSPPAEQAPLLGPDDPVTAVAVQRSHAPDRRIGNGAELLVVVRDETRLARANAPAGLTLRDVTGAVVADLEDLSERSRRGEHPVWSVAGLALDPGAYRLRVHTGSIGALEQTVVAVQGWQTQILLQRKSWGAAERGRRAALPDAAIFMAARGRGFDPDGRGVRLSQLARIGLIDGRVVLSEREMLDLAYGKWDDPMLGLYAAHLLPRTEMAAASTLSAEIRGNLRRLLGPHPDVVALDVKAGVSESAVPVPPMLRAGWDALVAASTTSPAVVPPGSLSFAVADRLFGSGAWLTWRPPERGRRHRLAAEDPPPSALASAAVELADAVGETPHVDESNLTPAARAAVSLAGEIARNRRRGTGRDLSDEEVVQTLAIPRSVAASAFADAREAVRSTSLA